MITLKSNKSFASKRNKGFTLTEMVIVIAVIAVLAAVLIPTFIGIANKAKISADLQTATSATTIAKTVTTGKTDAEIEIQDIYNEIVEDGGVDIFSTQSGGRFAYEFSTKQFVLLNGNYEIVDNEEASKATEKKLWLFVKNNESIIAKDSIKDTTYSLNYFLCNDYTGNFNLPTLSSFETGSSVLTGSVNLGNASTALDTNKTISVGGNINGLLTLNTPNAHVNQVGYIKNINAIAVASNSLNIEGRVDEVQVKKGRVAVKSGAYVNNVVIAPEAQTIKIESNGFINAIKPAENSTIPSDKVSLEIQSGYVGNIDAGVTDVLGNSSSEIQIANLEALENFRDQVNAGTTFAGITVKLTENIALQGAWTPIGAFFRDNYNVAQGKSLSFSGTFDGNNKVISGLTYEGFDVTKYPAMSGRVATNSTIVGKQEFAYGFFGVVTNATIKNLTIQNPQINIPTGSNIYYGDSVGAVVGFASGNLTMENVQVLNGNVSAYDCVGGLVGRIYQVESVRIANCKNTATVSGNAKIGGILGYAVDQINKTTNQVEITNCENEGTVNANMVQADKSKVVYAGGIMGYVGTKTLNVEISNCTVKGSISATFAVQGDTAKRISANAIVGFAVENSKVTEVSNTINEAVVTPNN